MPVVGTLLVVGVAVLAVALLVVLAHFVPAERRMPHNDVVGFVYAVVGVVYAVVLAMVVIATWESLSTARETTYTESNALMSLYWYGHSLPPPAHSQIENLTREYADAVVHEEWPLLDAYHAASPTAWTLANELRGGVINQQPTTLAEQARYDQALDAAGAFLDARRIRLNEATDGLPVILWVALTVGGLVTVAFAFLFGMSSLRAHAVIIFSLTLLVGVLLLVVYALNYPFSGAVRVNPDAFELALRRMASIG
jgi:hypothetical protein